MNNEQPSFSDTIKTVGEVSQGYPPSQGPFEKEKALSTLSDMEQEGKVTIEARGLVTEAKNKVEAITGVTPEVKDAASKALEASVRSLESKAKRNERSAGLWSKIRDIKVLSRDPSKREKSKEESVLSGAVSLIRETGEAARSLSSVSESEHLKRVQEARGEIKDVSKGLKLTLRERIYEFTDRKVREALAKQSQLENAIGIIRSRLGSVKEATDQVLEGNVRYSEVQARESADNLSKQENQFASATAAAQAANYTGYTPPEV
jgi:hypothetical protein